MKFSEIINERQIDPKKLTHIGDDISIGVERGVMYIAIANKIVTSIKGLLLNARELTRLSAYKHCDRIDDKDERDLCKLKMDLVKYEMEREATDHGTEYEAKMKELRDAGDLKTYYALNYVRKSFDRKIKEVKIAIEAKKRQMKKGS